MNIQIAHIQTSVKTMIREFISSSPKEVIGHKTCYDLKVEFSHHLFIGWPKDLFPLGSRDGNPITGLNFSWLATSWKNLYFALKTQKNDQLDQYDDGSGKKKDNWRLIFTVEIFREFGTCMTQADLYVT
jgi:hypothetical protein